MYHRFDRDGRASGVWLSRVESGYRLLLESGWQGAVALVEESPGYGHLAIDGEREPIAYARDGDTIHVHYRGRAYALRFADPLTVLSGAGDAGAQNATRAPMPGVVVKVAVTQGDAVSAGAVLMVIESMKLETTIRAPQDGIVESIHVKAGESFDRDALLVTLAQEKA